ncbi:unnamed protein product [Rhizophagus irregularis]|nr:unnamed protein product [Rhizophagus irregularis]
MELLHFKHSASRCGSPQSQGEASHESTVIRDKQPKEGGKEGPEAVPTIPADSLIFDEPEPETHNPSSSLPSIAVLGAGKALAGDYSGQYIIPPIFKLAFFILLVILIIWYICKLIFTSETIFRNSHDLNVEARLRPGSTNLGRGTMNRTRR